MAFRSVANELPFEGHEVRIVGLFAGERDDIPTPPQTTEIR